jgi:hypothetical protein
MQTTNTSAIRIYNLLNSFKNFFNTGKTVDLTQFVESVFNVKSDEDLYYLKPYIFYEIKYFEQATKKTHREDQILAISEPIKAYLNNYLFCNNK